MAVAAPSARPLTSAGSGAIAGRVALGVFIAATSIGLVALAALLYTVIRDGAGELDVAFIRNFASRIPSRAGIWPPLLGTIYLMGLVIVVSFPIGVGAAIYLEEFAPRNRFTAARFAMFVSISDVNRLRGANSSRYMAAPTPSGKDISVTNTIR